MVSLLLFQIELKLLVKLLGPISILHPRFCSHAIKATGVVVVVMHLKLLNISTRTILQMKLAQSIRQEGIVMDSIVLLLIFAKIAGQVNHASYLMNTQFTL